METEIKGKEKSGESMVQLLYILESCPILQKPAELTYSVTDPFSWCCIT